MQTIEQAVFTSAKTDRAQGYQLLGRSPGLDESDARELSVWGPSHGSLLAQSPDAASTNFFKLASGSHCVSRTSVAGAEYSGRGGALVYTQFLVAPPEVMERFANDPFALLRAAAASGALCVHETVPEVLEPLTLGGRAPVIDTALMTKIARDPGPAALAMLIQAALGNDRLAIYSETPCENLIAALLGSLPVACRPDFSFTTGLVFSPSRQVRISTLPADESEWRAISRRGITLLDVDGNAADEVTPQGWAAWVAAILESGKLSVLTAEIERARTVLSPAGLNELGEQLLDELHGRPSRATGDDAEETQAAGATLPPELPASSGATCRADASHIRSDATAVMPRQQSRAAHLDALAEKLAAQPPEVLEQLEKIDDLVFAAISGDQEALSDLVILWPRTAAELDPDLVEQSREQYLRCALSICSDFSAAGVDAPERALFAVDVLCVLFEE